MYNSVCTLIILILFTWRISILLVYDQLTQHLRERAGVGMIGKGDLPINFWSWLLGCFWCCSLVVAFLVNLLAPCANIVDVLLRPFAVSGGAILVHYMARMHLQLGE